MTLPASIHERPEEWLATALADGLSPGERRALDDHLAACEPCRALQADLAALDETLLRDFPLAVGPPAGFEARLVSGFRRRHGKGGRLARLRALAAWLLRQRGVRFAGVAAALLVLVGLGQMLTRPGERARATAIQNDARTVDGAIDESAIENNRSAVTTVDAQPPRPTYESHPIGGLVITGQTPVSVLNPTASNAHPGSLSLGAGYSSITSLTDLKSDQTRSSLSLTGTNTYTGTTVLSAGGTVGGTVAVAMSSPPISGNKVTQDKVIRREIPLTSSPTDQKVRRTENPAPASTPSPTPQSSPTVVRDIAAPVSESPTSTPVTDMRKLIRNASATLEVASFDPALDAITAAAAGNGGFLATRDSTRGDNGKVSGTVVCKVLPENLDRFLAGLRTVGSVEDQSIQTEDVTSDYFDTDARLRNARRMEDRLLKMLTEVKGKMSEVLQVEKEIGRVRADIESMQGRLKLYDAQVRYATVTLDVHEKDLDQPATFLLRQTATLALLASDVEKTATEARRIADAAHAQVSGSVLSRDPSGRTKATLHLSIKPAAAAEAIAQIKALGRVENFHLQDDRTAQNGDPSEETGEDAARVERAPVEFDLTISHDEQISRQVSFTLVAADAEGTFEKARAAALAAGGEIVNANVAHAQNGHASATLAVRVPAAEETGLLATLQALGRAGPLETQRIASGADPGGGPVLVQLAVADVEPAVQDTVVQVQTNDVERRAAEIKREAAAARVDVEGSSFSSEGDGRQRAGLRFRLPMSAYPGFIERVRALGTVKELVVRREERPGKTPGTTDGDANAPATVELTLTSEEPVVSVNSGLGATLRRTFGQGTGALAWSVQMIGVALAFLLPWAVLLTAVAAGARWWRRRRSARMKQGKTGPTQ